VNLGEIEETMAALALVRPLFHSEADFQHAFAWQLHSAHPDARIRLETRPRPGVRLDVMALIGGRRVAVELKYLLRDLSATVEDELCARSASAGNAVAAPRRRGSGCRRES
jgi:hypothetical protein